MRARAFWLLATICVLSAESIGAQSTDVLVLCSNVIKEAVERLRPAFEKSSGRRLVITYGASAELRRTALGGAPFDLALLTTGVIDELIKGGVVAAGSRVDIAQANLAVAARLGTPASDVSTAAGMRARLLSAASLTYSKDGGGVAAIEGMLKRLGIAAELQPRIVKQEAAGRAAEAVALGEQELAFAPLTEILAAPGAQVLGLLPEEFQSPLAIASGLGAAARNADGARALAAFLVTADSMRVIEATGMAPLITR